MKKTFITLAITILTLSTGALNPPIVFANSTSTEKIVIDNTSTNNKIYYINYSDYPGLGTNLKDQNSGGSWWPLRSQGCTASNTTVFKTLPWLPDNSGVDGFSYTGNNFKYSGNCSQRYTDGGNLNGAWLPGDAYGGWANNGSLNWGQAPIITSSNDIYSQKLADITTGIADPNNNYPDSQIWGQFSPYPNGHSVKMFKANGYTNYTISNSYDIYSSGTTLFRNEFTLTEEQLENIDTINLYAVADDWLNIYVNGVRIVEAQTNNSENLLKIELMANNAIKTALKAAGAGNHVIAIQVNDKARWSNSGVTASNKAGLSYKMEINLSETSAEDETASLSCIVTPQIGLAPLVVSVEANVTGISEPNYNYDMDNDGSYEYTNRSTPIYYTYERGGSYTVKVAETTSGLEQICSPEIVTVRSPSDSSGGEVAP